MAKEALVKAAGALGHEIHLETQGTIGVENELTPQQIADADVVLLAVDVHIEGRERFEGKQVVEVPTDLAIKAPKAVLNKISTQLGIK
jgi:PTS system fructose-specific IIB component